MNERLRKIILFVVIIIVGSVMIQSDMPLIIMIPLILGAGFIIMLLLGTIKISDIRSIRKKKEPSQEKKPSFFARFKRKKPEKTLEAKPETKKEMPPAKKVPEKSVDTKSADKKTGTGAPKKSFFSSIKSLGGAFSGFGKRKKKTAEIDRSLDTIVTGNGKGAPPASTKTGTVTSIPTKSGGPGTVPIPAQGHDASPPLPDTEFDANLLDGLEDQDPFGSLSPAPDTTLPATPGIGDFPGGEGESALPTLDIDSVANDILKQGAEGGGMDDFGGLPDLGDLGEGSALDEDFGSLDNLSLDDIELDAGEGVTTPAAETSSPPSGGAAKPASPTSGGVKTDWVSSDAPINAEKEVEQEVTHADMLTFASGTGGEDDLLSSLSTDVKHVKTEKNLSLLRNLKDFQAPATEIEAELLELYNRLKAIKNPEKKAPPATKGTK